MADYNALMTARESLRQAKEERDDAAERLFYSEAWLRDCQHLVTSIEGDAFPDGCDTHG